MPTTYTYPLTSSIEATTLFSSEIVPTFTTDTDISIYNIVSEYITIGNEINRNIEFTSSNFDNIIFSEVKNDIKTDFKLSTIYNFATGIQSDSSTITFLKNVSFVTENPGYVTFSSPKQILFKQPFGDYDLTVSLADYIKGNEWNFTKSITFSSSINFNKGVTFNDTITVNGTAKFSDPNNILIDNDTSIVEYIDSKTNDKLLRDGNNPKPQIEGHGNQVGIMYDNIFYNFEQLHLGFDNFVRLETNNDTNGLIFKNTFYDFEEIKTDIDNSVKLKANNDLGGDTPGLTFNGNFYSFEDLHVIYKNCEFKANGTLIEPENDILTHTVSSDDSSVVISVSTKSENEENDDLGAQLIFDAVVLDKNIPKFASITSKEDSSITLSINGATRDIYAWVIIKTLNDKTGNITTSTIFLRSKDTIKPPAHILGDYEYTIKYEGSVTPWKRITNWEVIAEEGAKEINIRNSALELMQAYVLSNNGYTELKGIGGDTITLKVDDTKAPSDWLVINCFDAKTANTFYRAIAIKKASPPNS